MQKALKTQLHGVMFLGVCAVVAFALILLMRSIYSGLSTFNSEAQLLPSWGQAILQYGVASFGFSIALAGIFTLLELQVTGRKRLASSYVTTFSSLFISLSLFAAGVYFFEATVAEFGLTPVFDFSASTYSLSATYALVLAYFFLADVLLYWVHRLEHINRALWYLHAIHHAQEDLDSVSGAFHPLSNIVRWLLTLFPLQFLIEVDVTQTLVLASLMSGLHYIQHTRAPFNFGWFGVVLGDNRFHFVHHSRDPEHYNKNFAAQFPVIDMIFGTYHHPVDDNLPETGLPNLKSPRSVMQFLSGRLDKR